MIDIDGYSIWATLINIACVEAADDIHDAPSIIGIPTSQIMAQHFIDYGIYSADVGLYYTEHI